MRYKLLVIVFALPVLLLLGACSTGGDSNGDYAALQEKYDSLKADYETLQQENELLRQDVETAAPVIEELQTRIKVAKAYSEFFDIYVDTWRWKAGQPAQYGYGDPAQPGDEYVDRFHEYAFYAGGEEFAQRVEDAFHLPPGEEKEKAFAEFHIHLADALMNATSVEFETAQTSE